MAGTTGVRPLAIPAGGRLRPIMTGRSIAREAGRIYTVTRRRSRSRPIPLTLAWGSASAA